MTSPRPYSTIAKVTVDHPEVARNRLTREFGPASWLNRNGQSFQIWTAEDGRVFTVVQDFAPKRRGQRNAPLFITTVHEIQVDG